MSLEALSSCAFTIEYELFKLLTIQVVGMPCCWTTSTWQPSIRLPRTGPIWFFLQNRTCSGQKPKQIWFSEPHLHYWRVPLQLHSLLREGKPLLQAGFKVLAGTPQGPGWDLNPLPGKSRFGRIPVLNFRSAGIPQSEPLLIFNRWSWTKQLSNALTEAQSISIFSPRLKRK